VVNTAHPSGRIPRRRHSGHSRPGEITSRRCRLKGDAKQAMQSLGRSPAGESERARRPITRKPQPVWQSRVGARHCRALCWGPKNRSV